MNMKNAIENHGKNRIVRMNGIRSAVVRKKKNKMAIGKRQQRAEEKKRTSREFDESYGDEKEKHGRTLGWPFGRVQKHLHSPESASVQSFRRSTMAAKFRCAEDKSKVTQGIVIREYGAEDDEIMSNGEGSASSFETMGSHEKRKLTKLLTGPKSQTRMTLERVRQILADVKASLTIHDQREVRRTPKTSATSVGEDEERQCVSSIMPTKKLKMAAGKSKVKGNPLERRGDDAQSAYVSRRSKRKSGVQRHVQEEEDISHGTQDRCKYGGRIESEYNHQNEEGCDNVVRSADEDDNNLQHFDNSIPSRGRFRAERYCVRDSKGRYKKPLQGERDFQQDTTYGVAAKSDSKSSKDMKMCTEKWCTDDLSYITAVKSNYLVPLSHTSISDDECLENEYFSTNGMTVIKKGVHTSTPVYQKRIIQDEGMAIEQPNTDLDALEFHGEKSRRRKKRKVTCLEGDLELPMITHPFSSGGLCPGSASKVDDWDPPMSPFNLLQESFRKDPWKVMLSSMLLNKATGRGVDKIILELFTVCLDAQSAINTPTEIIADIVYSLGLQNKRAKMIQRFSYEYQRGDWTNVAELHGIGKYAIDSYAIFYQGLWREVVPDDPLLIKYWNWLNDFHGSESENAHSNPSNTLTLCK